MREIDDRALNEVEPRKDAELTLGSFALLAISFGLILLCGVFFGLGYSVGKRSAAEPATTAQSATGPLIPSDYSRPKPSASAQPGGSATASSDVAPPSTTFAANEDHQPVAVTGAGAVPSAESTEGKSAVRPAVAEAAMTADVPQTNAGRVAPAFGSQTQLTVQVAAVSQQQDADVLASALRKRGYAAIAHRDAADNLIHVRIGPFTTREDAEKWRQKLLSDGYNAGIQP